MSGQELLPPLVVHPATAEVLDTTNAGGDQLAQWHDQLAAIKRAADVALKDVDAELRQRMGDRKLWAAGEYEVSVTGANKSEWDGEELEAVLRDLVAHSVVQAGDVTDVIRHETSVSAREADRLSKQLTGAAHTAVEACRTWVRQPGRIVVKQSVALPRPQDRTP